MPSAKQPSAPTPATSITSRVVVKLPNGEILSVADLPDPHVWWTVRRKWIVAQAVLHGLLPYDEALRRYWMHPEELEDWIAKVRFGGKRRLKATVREPAPRSDG